MTKYNCYFIQRNLSWRSSLSQDELSDNNEREHPTTKDHVQALLRFSDQNKPEYLFLGTEFLWFAAQVVGKNL